MNITIASTPMLNKRRITASLLFCAAMLILASCKQSTTSTTLVDASSLTGDLAGQVFLYDKYAQPMADFSGATIRVDGTQFSATTDHDGYWVIHGLPTRTYSLTVSKDGFCSYHIRSFSFVGGGVENTGQVQIGVVPAFSVTLDAVLMASPTVVDSTGFPHYYNGTVYAHSSDDGPASITYPAFCYVSKQASIDPADPSTYLFYLTCSQGNTRPTHDSVLSVSAQFLYSSLLQSGLKPGDSVYFRAYPVQLVSAELDPYTQKQIITGFGPKISNTLSAVMR